MSESFLIAIAAFALFLSAGALSLVFVRDLNRRQGSSPHSNTDLTNMTILFHTMRDVLSQQKQLAHEFNQSLDRRVTEIRKVVDAIRQEREMLRSSRSQLNELVARARELEVAAKEMRVAAPKPVAVETDEPVSASVVDAITTVPEDDFIENWTGLDFEDDPEEEFPDEAIEPVAPEDAQAARDAFRTLLNLDEAESDVPEAPAVSPATNGREAARSMEQLVYEYADAGMRIPDIARELGVGKGEVRLILSLRTKKTP